MPHQLPPNGAAQPDDSNSSDLKPTEGAYWTWPYGFSQAGVTDRRCTQFHSLFASLGLEVNMKEVLTDFLIYEEKSHLHTHASALIYHFIYSPDVGGSMNPSRAVTSQYRFIFL